MRWKGWEQKSIRRYDGSNGYDSHSELDAARDLAGLLARVRAGADVVIESGTQAVAVLRIPEPPRRSIEECIAILPLNSTAIMDEDFARDVVEAVGTHREPLNSSAWE